MVNSFGKEDFKGGFYQYSDFILSEATQQNKADAALYAAMWTGANQLCIYEGKKLGYGQPQWWYKCWEYLDSLQNEEE